MSESDYRKIIEGLEAASRTLEQHRGELTDSDLRLRQLIRASQAEARRRLEALRRVPPPAPAFSGGVP